MSINIENRRTLLFKSNGILFSNVYSTYQSSIFWSKLLIWHLSGILWSYCEISYTYDYSSGQGDHSKLVRFEKRDVKTFVIGSVFAGHFSIYDRLVLEFKLFLFLGHKITVCVLGSWNEINPFITKYSKICNFEIPLIRRAGCPIHITNLWNNKADIVISSFNNEWALLVHWWQRQPTVESSLRGDESAPDTPPAKPCAPPVKPCEAARHFGLSASVLICWFI